MALKELFTNSSFAKHHRAVKAAPREIIYNRSLILSSILYAMSAIPLTWDQASAASVPSLPGFQKHFQFRSGNSALEIRNFISIVYIGAGVGAALSFFLNDILGRRWSFRLYTWIWIVGQLVATSSPTLAGLYVSRIISGLGMGALTVIGPMSIVEIAPAEIRGMLTAWFNIAMNMSATCGAFCVLGVYKNMSGTSLQYQVVWFSPCIYMFLCFIASFFICESPRWLFLVDRHEEATEALVTLRGLPAEHPRLQRELQDIQHAIREEKALNKEGILGIFKEALTIPSNLRRVQQSLVSYGLAQLSGANSVTSYFVPILSLMGIGGDTTRNIFLSGMYTFAKFCFAIIASFFFVDALGRRKSLFVGACLQMISDIYIGVYIKYSQQGNVSDTASTGAVAFIFVHGFGYVVGLYILPYVFGGELWPNRIRSFGSALSQCFHWLFIFAMAYGAPSLLKTTNNWGAFIFFAGWCFISLLYVYLMVPETSGLSVEEMDDIFRGSWFNAARRSKKQTTIHTIDGREENVKM
ncbi:general substrate transporter [Dactylonectria macrodidyma]|uniref:General substrate transporter n=1 Tax=Dactylonectria macrodidyma TaxID=307937 RepID=A0A9P9J5K5_9HYPO|nr:general substrate transporter [Dactylonectria macrodidyma]